MEEKSTDKIDLLAIVNKIIAKKRLFFKVLPITFVVSSIFIIGFPRDYTTDIKLAPELNSSMSNMGGALSSIASSFGFDISDMQTSDAITPLLYPNLMEDNKFICNLFNIRVVSIDKKINTTYHDYLLKEQKPIIWMLPLDWIKNLFSKKEIVKNEILDPYHLDKPNDEVAKAVRGNISIKIDKKTAIITIETRAQDPLICQTIADSVRERLQSFITEYRTNKARIDYEYYKNLTAEAKAEYEKARQKYASISDASTHIVLKSLEQKMEDMENDLQLRFSTYSTLNTQLQAAKARVQERTPAFTIIKGAEVPIKPTGPKRMIFVIACLFIAFVSTSVYILAKDAQEDNRQ